MVHVACLRIVRSIMVGCGVGALIPQTGMMAAFCFSWHDVADTASPIFSFSSLLDSGIVYSTLHVIHNHNYQ